MPTLLLRLSAPMQSWGSNSNFETRRTETFPTKSGVIGLLASALGRSRDDSLDDLNKLKFGIRVDNQGKIIEDFHTARIPQKNSCVTYRHYLSDATFLAGFECDDIEFLQKLENALKNPVYPLFLGKRSCPPTMPLLIGIRDSDLLATLRAEPWLLSEWQQKNNNKLRIIADCSESDLVLRDMPVSFSQEHRKFVWRKIKDYGYVNMSTADTEKSTCHDIMAELR